MDLASDPAETKSVLAAHPEVVETHRARMSELGRDLAAEVTVPTPLTDEDRARLRALGYLE